MSKRAAVKERNQERTTVVMSAGMQQLMLPLLVAMDATKKGLLAFVQQMGMTLLSELLVLEAERLVGPKGKHIEGREHHHWGTATTAICFGGRNVSVEHPRVRVRGKGKGGEVVLPTIEELREADPLSDRVAEQVVLGVSTRNYERSLEPIDDSIESRGTSKSNASRALIDATTEKLMTFVTRRLDDVELVGMFIDGIDFAGHTVVIALGVTVTGEKVPLGLWAGSTENSTVTTALLTNLVERGLRVTGPMLFVIDGSKALRKSLRDVFGDRAKVQRCQVHKTRNVTEHLPESRRGYVARQMRDAYASSTPKTAKKKLLQLVSWLESNGEDSAAASLREGLDETLTVLGLGLPPTLRRSFATTNAIENMNGALRRVARNVKRWRDETMIRRWVAFGIAEAQRGFRRVKGYKDIHVLVAALRPAVEKEVEVEKKVA